MNIRLLPPAGHFAVFMNSAEFLNQLDAKVKPLAVDREP
jgi:hypothetical protein